MSPKLIFDEACSAFTHVATRQLAHQPKADFVGRLQHVDCSSCCYPAWRLLALTAAGLPSIKRESPYGSRQRFIWTHHRPRCDPHGYWERLFRLSCLTPATSPSSAEIQHNERLQLFGNPSKVTQEYFFECIPERFATAKVPQFITYNPHGAFSGFWLA